MPVATKSMIGWVILHPNGWVESDYFSTEIWFDKGIVVSLKKWMKAYRPSCRVVRATVTWPVPQDQPKASRKKASPISPRPIKRRKHSKSRSIRCPICAPDRCVKAPW